MVDQILDDPADNLNWDIIHISSHRTSRTAQRIPKGLTPQDVVRTKHVYLKVHYRNGDTGWAQMEAVKL